MNTIFKRITVLCLALLMTVGVVFGAVACAETPDEPNPDETTAGTTAGNDNGAADESAAETGNGTTDETTAGTPGGETTAEKEETDRTAYSSMQKQNFGGKKFVICSREEVKADMDVEKLTGNILDDAIYERNKTVAEDFGIQFVIDTQGDYNAVNTTLSTQATSGGDEYDIYLGHKFSFNACAQQNYCLNLNNISALQLDAEWWDQDCYKNLTVGGKTFCMTGDISPSSMRASSCYIYN